MNRARILLILMALAVPVVAQQRWPKEPTAFGGLRWGATVAEAKQAYPSAQQSIWGNGPSLHYNLDVGTVSTRVCLDFKDDHLVQVRMEFSNSGFNEMRKVFIEKYGSPARVTSEEGDPILWWQGKTVRIRLYRYTGDEAGAVFSVVSYVTEQLQRQKRDAEQSKAKDKEKMRHAKDAF